MPISRAIARSAKPSPPCSTSTRRAVSLISRTVSARTRSRRLSGSAGISADLSAGMASVMTRAPSLDFGERRMQSERRSLTVFTSVIDGNTGEVMFEALGRVIYRRRRWVVSLALLLVAAAAVWGTGVFGKLTGAGFDDPGSESAHAAQAAAAHLGRDGADVVVLYSSRDLTVDDAAFREAVTTTLDALPADEVARTTTFWSTGAAPLVSENRHATYAVLTL